MKIVISPAKNLNIGKDTQFKQFTEFYFKEEALQLVDIAKQLSPPELSSLMKISDKLANLNYARFQDWHLPFTPENSLQAIFAFQGDVYKGMDAISFDEQDLEFAQQYLRILSGLYGILKPLDLIQAYRLEMGTRLKNPKGKNLYEFWGNKITDFLNNEFAEEDNPVLINLASNEYFKVIRPENLKATIITPQFKEYRNNELKIISFSAKKARGRMSRFIIKNKITQVEDIKAFDWDNYRFDENLSDATTWIFTR